MVKLRRNIQLYDAPLPGLQNNETKTNENPQNTHNIYS